jgi:hypothetical protein
MLLICLVRLDHKHWNCHDGLFIYLRSHILLCSRVIDAANTNREDVSKADRAKKETARGEQQLSQQKSKAASTQDRADKAAKKDARKAAAAKQERRR